MDGILYLNVGPKHLRNLVVSLMTLRDHWDGAVCVLSGDGLFEKTVRLEGILGDVQVQPFNYDRAAKRGSVYFAKTQMHRLTPFDRTIYLDGDTTIHSDIRGLFPTTPEVVNWTQFSDWTTAMKRIFQRIDKWKDILPDQYAYQTAQPYPAINTGVLGFSSTSSRMMDAWHDTTRKNIGFICDEVCAQLLAYDYPHCIFDHSWNASPSYPQHQRPLGIGDEVKYKIKIVHNHGNKGLKAEERNQQQPAVRKKQSIWLSNYFRAYRDDVGGISTWGDSIFPARRPAKYVHDIEGTYQHWLTTGEISGC